MPFNALVEEKIRDFEQQGIPKIFTRDLSLGRIQKPTRGNLANIVVGTRRCGKTYRLFQEMHAIIAAGYSPESILYFNFEDERFKPYQSTLLTDVLDTFYALHPNAKQNGAFLFFDEIQEIPEWGTFLRRVIDSYDVTVYATGSSSKMLSTELGSEFRGRSLSRELFPLSFSEFVRLQCGKRFTANDSLSAADQALLRNCCRQYLEQGGYYATLQLPRADATLLLQEYAYRTVAMDVIERYNIRNPQVATLFLSRCMASSARELSINKTFNDMRSLGIATSREMLSSLAQYYEDSYLLFRVNEYSRSLASNPRSISKTYAVDPGMFAAFSPSSTQEAGQRLETAVFNKLRRETPVARSGAISRLVLEANSYRSHEIDFIVGDAMLDQATNLVQVCLSLENAKTLKRETSALEAAMKMFGVSEGTIVTADEAKKIETEAGIIHGVPAWKWLLDE